MFTVIRVFAITIQAFFAALFVASFLTCFILRFLAVPFRFGMTFIMAALLVSSVSGRNDAAAQCGE